jgi:ubiquitin-conjugating enzyme E2 R
MSGERAEERWNPVQTPETILLSVITLLSDPNFSSPANVDASVECKNKNSDYIKRIKDLVKKSLNDLPENFVMTYKKSKKVEKKSPKMDDFILSDDEVYVYDPDAISDEENSDNDLNDLNEEEIEKLLEEEERKESLKNEKKEEKKL